MPYYKDRKPLFEITPDFLDHERIYKLTELGISGWGSQETSFTIRGQAVEDYKGYYVALSMSLSWAGRRQPTFYICKVGGKFDARYCEHHEVDPGPWAISDNPSVEAIESHYQPIDKAGRVDEFIRLFEAVEKEALADHVVSVDSEEKRQALNPFDAELSDFECLFGMIVKDEPEYLREICSTFHSAASDPFNFLTKNNELENWGLDDCRNFHWNHLIAGTMHLQNSPCLSDQNYCVSIDWKSEQEDLEWALSEVAGKVAPQSAIKFQLPDFIYESDIYQHDFNLYDWFVLADEQLSGYGYRLVFLGPTSDSFCFTFVEAKNLDEFVRLGEKLAAGVEAIPDEYAMPQVLRAHTKKRNFWGKRIKKTWIQRLFGG